LWPLGTLWPFWTLRAGRAGITRWPLNALRTLRARSPIRAGRAGIALRPLGSCWTLRALGTGHRAIGAGRAL
jgi:hypothetical protein